MAKVSVQQQFFQTRSDKAILSSSGQVMFCFGNFEEQEVEVCKHLQLLVPEIGHAVLGQDWYQHWHRQLSLQLLCEAVWSQLQLQVTAQLIGPLVTQTASAGRRGGAGSPLPHEWHPLRCLHLALLQPAGAQRSAGPQHPVLQLQSWLPLELRACEPKWQRYQPFALPA